MPINVNLTSLLWQYRTPSVLFQWQPSFLNNSSMASELALSFLGDFGVRRPAVALLKGTPTAVARQQSDGGPSHSKHVLYVFNTRLLYFDRLAKEQVGRSL